MNDFRSKMQNEILMQFRGVLYTVAFGCGGVIFRQHFIKLLGYGESKGSEIIRYMEDFKLIKHRKLGRNYLLIHQAHHRPLKVCVMLTLPPGYCKWLCCTNLGGYFYCYRLYNE